MHGFRIIGRLLALLLIAASPCYGQQRLPIARSTAPAQLRGVPSSPSSSSVPEKPNVNPGGNHNIRQGLQRLSTNDNSAAASTSPGHRSAGPISSSASLAEGARMRGRVVPASFQQEQPLAEATAEALSQAKPGVTETTSQPAFLDLDSPDTTQTAADATQPSDTDMIARLATWTVIILCLCVLTALGVRRWQRKNGMLPETHGNSRVLETVSLGPNRSVCLVQLRDIQAVVGCDASGIQSIVLAPASFDEVMGEADHGQPVPQLDHHSAKFEI